MPSSPFRCATSARSSSLDAGDPDGASGGRVNGLGASRQRPGTFYAASEWGGLFRSTDSGQRGRMWRATCPPRPGTSRSIRANVEPRVRHLVLRRPRREPGRHQRQHRRRRHLDASGDGDAAGRTSAAESPAHRAVGVRHRASIRANADRVFVGTNCGLAISTDNGATWTFVDPTPGERADRRVGRRRPPRRHHRPVRRRRPSALDRRRRHLDTPRPLPLPGGRCSIAASPDEAYVLFAAVGTTIFETDDGGATWPARTPIRRRRAASRSSPPTSGTRAGFDLWFGDVRLHRGTCTTPNPAAAGGAQRCTASAAWAGPFTRSVGGHDDTADIVFAPGVAATPVPCCSPPTAASTSTRSPRAPTAIRRRGSSRTSRRTRCGTSRSPARASRRAARGPVFRQPGQRHLRHDQRRRGTPVNWNNELLRRLRRGRRQRSRV